METLNIETVKNIRKMAATVRFAGTVRYTKEDGRLRRGFAYNMGLGELCLRCGEHMLQGTTVRVILDCLRYKKIPIALPGRVVWCRSSEDEKEYMALIHLDDSAEVWEAPGDGTLHVPWLKGESIP